MQTGSFTATVGAWLQRGHIIATLLHLIGVALQDADPLVQYDRTQTCCAPQEHHGESTGTTMCMGRIGVCAVA